MKRIIRTVGTAVYWLGWPFYFIYFRLMQRTRVLLTRGEEILVVSNWLSDGRWNLPGGGLHRGEDPLAGMLREVHEELGVALPKDTVKMLGVHVYRSHGHRYLYTQFTAEVRGELRLTLQWHEIAAASWMHYSQLTSKNATSDVLLAIQEWRQEVSLGR